MNKTRILTPLQNLSETATEAEKSQRAELKRGADEIYQKLDEIDKQNRKSVIEQPISFEQFLAELDLSEEGYVNTLRYYLKRPTVFLQRNLDEIRINAYNPIMLDLWKANLDLQYIIDPYACVMYVVSYIGKSQRGMSRILKDALKEIRSGNKSIQQQLRGIAHKFQCCSEVSAQEVVFHLLSLPLSKCSRSNVFINTSPSEKRVRLLKPKVLLQKLELDSEEIACLGLIDHYMSRPDQLEEICLAEFAAWYEFQSSKSKRHTNKDMSDISGDEEEGNPSLPIPLKDGTGYIRKRTKTKIIRYRRYDIQQDEMDYYREQLMLYIPFRDERKDLLDCDIKFKFDLLSDQILETRNLYQSSKQEEIEQAVELIENIDPEQLDFDNWGGEEIKENEEDRIFVKDDDSFILENPGDNFIPGTPSHDADRVSISKRPKLKSDEEYLDMCKCLNLKQRKELLSVLHRFKNDAMLPFYEFVSGGAGVGKSMLIRCLYESLIRYFDKIPGANPDMEKVLLVAPTGKAAFNIGGLTLHSAFSLPVNQFSGEMPDLNANVCNTLRTRLIQLKLLIIDEVSMVGSKMLKQLNERLMQIMDSNQHFGGVSIICVGDFHQLKPVGDR